MSQADLARAANVSLSMIRKVEQGNRNPSDAILEAITTALGLDPPNCSAAATVSTGAFTR